MIELTKPDTFVDLFDDDTDGNDEDDEDEEDEDDDVDEGLGEDISLIG